MGYVFGDPEKHTRAVIEILHRMRWDEEMPDSFEGLDWNLLLETAVDELNRIETLRAGIQRWCETYKAYELAAISGGQEAAHQEHLRSSDELFRLVNWKSAAQ